MPEIKSNRDVVLTIILMLLSSFMLHAQDRSASPAFPVGAGEKMIVIAGATIGGSSYLSGSAGGLYALLYIAGPYQAEGYQLNLPVGSRLKRMIVQAADEVTATFSEAYVHIRLMRYHNDNPDSSPVIIRSVFTANLDSSSLSDFKQLVSNPIDHVVLQGWTYWIYYERGGDFTTAQTLLSNVKIIYEP